MSVLPSSVVASLDDILLRHRHQATELLQILIQAQQIEGWLPAPTLTLHERKNALALQVKSPKAPPQLKTRIAEGDDHIDVAGPGYTLAGKLWRCEEPARKITIRDGAQVVFQAPLIDLLK